MLSTDTNHQHPLCLCDMRIREGSGQGLSVGGCEQFLRGIDSVLWLLRFNQLVYWLWFSIWLRPSVPCVWCSVVSVYLIRKYVMLYQHCQDSGHQPMSSSTFVSRQTPGPSVRGMVLAFVCWLQCCSAAVLQPDILRHAGTCCLLPARSRCCVPSLQHHRQQHLLLWSLSC